MTESRNFNGRRYSLSKIFQHKDDAEDYVEKQRAKGKRARLINEKYARGWLVYTT